jgi:hypothetical protein
LVTQALVVGVDFQKVSIPVSALAVTGVASMDAMKNGVARAATRNDFVILRIMFSCCGHWEVDGRIDDLYATIMLLKKNTR